MKRFHINLGVTNLPQSIIFYTSLFGEPPTVEKNDYAKWLLDDPHVNFSISTHSSKAGVDHVGIQAENNDEFNQLRERLSRADAPKIEQEDVTCCYAKSSKTWIHDPDGIAWETFLTHGESTVFNDMTGDNSSACCVPSTSCCDSN